MTIDKKKPIPLRVVFILNLLKIFLAAGLYTYFTANDITLGEVGPQIILYTGIAYVVLFIGIIIVITKRNLLALKIIIFIDLLASLPAKAFAGILIAIISLLLLFFNKKIRYYFE